MQDQGIFIAGGQSYFDPPNLNKIIYRTNNLMEEVYEIYFRYIGESTGEWTTIQKCSDGNISICGCINYINTTAVLVAKIGSDIPYVVIDHSNLGLPITDNNITLDIINYVGMAKTQTSALLSVDVMIDTVLHTSTGDLEFTLSHNGIIDTLIYHAGESGDNFIQTILSDVAQSPVDLASAPFTGFYRSTSSLSKFSGVDPTGDWTLSILDNVAGNTGMLNSWGLRFYFEGPVGVDDKTPELISDYHLFQNYPNPFNPKTVISYQLPVSGNVTLKVYDVLGNEIVTLVDEYKPAGEYKVDFSIGQDSSPDITSGIYFYQLRAGDFIQTKKMLLLK
jgi:subtilisin-like proprotein convertase family protein